MFRAHDIGYFFYNGGNDSMDTALEDLADRRANELSGDLHRHPQDGRQRSADHRLLPGFGSVAKYIAVSTLEEAFDVASMARTSTKVFVLEVMGRHAGWIAAAGGLAGRKAGATAAHHSVSGNHLRSRAKFLERVQQCVGDYGYCVIVVSEGARHPDGKFLAESGTQDAFGHTQLGGVGPVVANMVREAFGYKYHWAVADYLQRSARHIASRTDVEQAYAVGKAAVQYALAGMNAVMPAIKRLSSKPYRWKLGAGAPERGGQRREEGAAQFHHRRRVWHHRRLPALSRAADRRRGLSRPIATACPPTCRIGKALGSAPAQEPSSSELQRPLPRRVLYFAAILAG
jgi:6-phosphofructokinase